MYDKLVEKVNNIDISGFVLKTKYDTDKLELEKKTPNTCVLAKKLDDNSKSSKIENKIPRIDGLATTYAMSVVENKISDVNNLVKKPQIMTQKLTKLKRKLLIIIMVNILPLQGFNNLPAGKKLTQIKQNI